MRAAHRYADRMAALPAHDVTTTLGVDAARALGSTRIILQTGDRQPDAVRLYGCTAVRLYGCTAVRLYEREGYTRIPVFPPYEWLSFSICMEKVLR